MSNQSAGGGGCFIVIVIWIFLGILFWMLYTIDNDCKSRDMGRYFFSCVGKDGALYKPKIGEQ